MTIKEQILRIIKAAPYLPYQALTGASILFFAIPILIIQMFDEGMVRWVETKGAVADHQNVHERKRNGEPEYFYYIAYEFNADGKQFRAFFERGFMDRTSAESHLKAKLSEQGPITFWYDQSNPSNATFEKGAAKWPVYVSLLVLLTLVLAYFRWLFLKYYELELSD